VHFDAYFYGEMAFILVNGETSKRQEKQLFADWWPVIDLIRAVVTWSLLGKQTEKNGGRPFGRTTAWRE